MTSGWSSVAYATSSTGGASCAPDRHRVVAATWPPWRTVETPRWDWARVTDLDADESEKVKQFMHGLPDGPVAFHYEAPDYEQQLLGGSQ